MYLHTCTEVYKLPGAHPTGHFARKLSHSISFTSGSSLALQNSEMIRDLSQVQLALKFYITFCYWALFQPSLILRSDGKGTMTAESF